MTSGSFALLKPRIEKGCRGEVEMNITSKLARTTVNHNLTVASLVLLENKLWSPRITELPIRALGLSLLVLGTIKSVRLAQEKCSDGLGLQSKSQVSSEKKYLEWSSCSSSLFISFQLCKFFIGDKLCSIGFQSRLGRLEFFICLILFFLVCSFKLSIDLFHS